MHRPAAIAVVAVLAGGAAVAAAAADDDPPVAGLPFVARVVHVNVVGDRYALEPGDRLFADGSVLLGDRGRRVGVATFTCTVTDLDPRVDGTCDATLHLPLGHITGRWPLARSRTPREGRITGGSGFYRDARGRFLLEPTLRNGDTPFAIDLAS